jgi:UDP-glucose 4-epimerase
LSTDKSAYPINAMGISKAMMEKVFIAKSISISSEKTLIFGTRYGNVMASRGSVIPLLVDQIKKGENLTLTDPNMTRFLMSLDEAVELVVFAFQHAQAGDILVQKSPSCTIRDLAIALKELFNVSNNIRIIGSRHGEKLYETLMTKEESFVAEDLKNYYRIPADKRDLNYEKNTSEENKLKHEAIEYNSHNTNILSIDQIKEKLLDLDYIKEELRNWNLKK